MRTTLAAACIATAAWAWSADLVFAQTPRDPDALYTDREALPSALAAAAEWERRLTADPDDFESAWKLARACYWLGSHVPQADRRARLERGIDAGRRASTLRPDRPDGFFWMAANMGAMAESFGLRAGLRYRGPVKEALETALTLDASYLKGAPDRALGRWYMRVPRLFGGSDATSEAHLRKALTYGPDSIATRFFLAETLLELDRRNEARRELETMLAAPLDPDWAPEDREFKTKARALLDGLARR